MCLDITKFATSNGTAVQQWRCTGNVNQAFGVPALDAPQVYVGVRVHDSVSYLESPGVVGAKFAIIHNFYKWGDAFPGENEVSDYNNDQASLMTWELWTRPHDMSSGISLVGIARGSYDAELVSQAQAFVLFNRSHPGHRMFLRLMHEMNGTWYPWAGPLNGASGDVVYVDAFRHIHDVFNREGVTNLSWIWCPNASDIGGPSWNHFPNYYPGDDYVDYVGDDVYPYGSPPNQSFSSAAAAVYDWNHRYHGKPFFVAETAVADEGRAAWLAQTEVDIKQSMPDLEAFVWFSVTYGGTSQDNRIQTSASSIGAFRGLMHDPYFERMPGH
jgi:hypothetical protein